MTPQLKPIPSWPGYYATSTGEIWSSWARRSRHPRKRVRLWSLCWQVKARVEPHGYLTVNIRRPGKTTVVKVHSLVAEAFIGTRPSGMQVCHNNGIRTDNRALNLRYDTSLGNHQDMVRHDTLQVGERNPAAKLVAADVKVVRMLRQHGFTLAKIATLFEVNVQTVCYIAKGQHWRHVR